MIKKIEVWDHSVGQVSTEVGRAASIVRRFANRANEAADLLGPESTAARVKEAEELLYECGDVLALLADSLRDLDEDVLQAMLNEGKS